MNETSNDLVSAALVKVQGELEPATFDSTNPFLRNRYASLGAVIQQSRPVLAKHGLAMLQTPFTNGEAVCVRTEIVHSSGQTLNGGTLELHIGEEKGKSRAQVAGSLITYLRRYAWASVLGMYADEDTDGNAPHKKEHSEAPERFEDTKPPVDIPKPSAKVPEGKTDHKTATIQMRMKALNNLLATPGQHNRALVKHFLLVKGWIKGVQEPEEWSLEHVPTTKEGYDILAEDVAHFDRTQREQVQP